MANNRWRRANLTSEFGLKRPHRGGTLPEYDEIGPLISEQPHRRPRPMRFVPCGLDILPIPRVFAKRPVRQRSGVTYDDQPFTRSADGLAIRGRD
jgi:hypothetical protein